MKEVSPDSVLIDEALSGSEDAYAQLVERYQTMVASLAERTTHRPEWVEDLTQEAFLSAFQNLSKFRKNSRFTTWLYRITVNTCFEALRKENAQKRRVDQISLDNHNLPDSLIVGSAPNGERIVLDRELQVRVRDSLNRLTPNSKVILTLRYLEELSTGEVAEVLEIAVGTVRSRLYYARLELAEVLGPFMEMEAPAKAKKR